MGETVVVLGASNKIERYANKVQKALVHGGHNVLPVNPALKEIDGIKVINHLKDIKDKVDTVTLYLGPQRLIPLIPEVIALNPMRVISNPGTECEEMKQACDKAKIEYIEACTLVMLSTGQYEK